MVTTDKFVFIHIPKTGGSFIRELLGDKSFEHINPVFDYYHHAPASVYTGDLPIIIVERDFYSWVKSWKHYWKNRPKESTNPYLACLWGKGSTPNYYDGMYKYMTDTKNEIIKLDFNNLRADLCNVFLELGVLTEENELVTMNKTRINVTDYGE